MGEEVGTGIAAYIRERFSLPEVDIRTYSPPTLAYIGDGVFELVIRTIIVEKGNAPASALSQRASQVARAGTQAKMLDAILPLLTEEEEDAFRRGRNAHTGSMAKNATMGEYRRATGLEAMIGWLYLRGDFERIVELVREGVERLGLGL